MNDMTNLKQNQANFTGNTFRIEQYNASRVVSDNPKIKHLWFVGAASDLLPSDDPHQTRSISIVLNIEFKDGRLLKYTFPDSPFDWEQACQMADDFIKANL